MRSSVNWRLDSMVKLMFIILVSFELNLTPVFCYYCDHALCSSTDQYCCGDNLCCDYANSWWYFWVSVLLILLIISLIWGLIGFFCLDSANTSSLIQYYFPSTPGGIKGSSLTSSASSSSGGVASSCPSSLASKLKTKIVNQISHKKHHHHHHKTSSFYHPNDHNSGHSRSSSSGSTAGSTTGLTPSHKKEHEEKRMLYFSPDMA